MEDSDAQPVTALIADDHKSDFNLEPTGSQIDSQYGIKAEQVKEHFVRFGESDGKSLKINPIPGQREKFRLLMQNQPSFFKKVSDTLWLRSRFFRRHPLLTTIFSICALTVAFYSLKIIGDLMQKGLLYQTFDRDDAQLILKNLNDSLNRVTEQERYTLRQWGLITLKTPPIQMALSAHSAKLNHFHLQAPPKIKVSHRNPAQMKALKMSGKKVKLPLKKAIKSKQKPKPKQRFKASKTARRKVHFQK